MSLELDDRLEEILTQNPINFILITELNIVKLLKIIYKIYNKYLERKIANCY